MSKFNFMETQVTGTLNYKLSEKSRTDFSSKRNDLYCNSNAVYGFF